MRRRASIAERRELAEQFAALPPAALLEAHLSRLADTLATHAAALGDNAPPHFKLACAWVNWEATEDDPDALLPAARASQREAMLRFLGAMLPELGGAR